VADASSFLVDFTKIGRISRQSSQPTTKVKANLMPMP
jgi:hypothetical protein